MAMTSSHASMGLFDGLIIDEVIDSYDTQMEEIGAEPGAETSHDFVENEFNHIVDAVVITVIAWAVIVIVSSSLCH